MKKIKVHKLPKFKKRILIVLIILLCLPISFTLGRFVYNKVLDLYFTSKNFFFESDKLTVDGAVYSLDYWNGVDPYNVVINLNSFKNLNYVNFSGSGIQSIPDKMFLNCTKITSFEGSFAYCENLTTIGEGVFDGCDNVTSFAYTFEECTNLRGNVPELWKRVPNGENNGYIGIPDGESCYHHCNNVSNINDIPEYWAPPDI